MVAVCAVCYILCLVQGIIAYTKRQVKPKKLDKNSKKWYDRISIFTMGYEAIEQMV